MIKPLTIPPKKLAQSILSTDMAFIPNNILGWDGNPLQTSDFGSTCYAVFKNSTNTVIEIIEIDVTTIANAEITILNRGMAFDGTLVTVPTQALDWSANDTSIMLGTDAPQLWQALKDYIDAVAIAGAPDASSTVKGIVRLSVSPGTVLGNPTITIASPGVITLAAHGLTIGDQVVFTTTGALPTGITAGTVYYVISVGLTTNSFEISAVLNGSVINTSGSQSGVHTLTRVTPVAISDTDPRILTSAQAAAVAGGGAFGSPSGANKFITQQYLTNSVAYGTGADGDVTISSPTTLTRDMYYHNLTVNSTLTTNGYRIFVSGTLSGNGSGTIDYGAPNPGIAATSISDAAAPASSGAGQFRTNPGGAGEGNVVSNHSLGGKGGVGGHAGTSSNTGTAPGTVSQFVGVLPSVLRSSATLAIDILGTDIGSYTGGTGGSGGGSGAAAGGTAAGGSSGGSGGGLIWIAALIWAGTFTIKSIGANGGDFYNGGAGSFGVGGPGGGGGGGAAIIIFGTKTWTGSYNFAGGTAGAPKSPAYHDSTPGNDGATGSAYELQLFTLL